MNEDSAAHVSPRKSVIKMMDRLITNPPTIAIDADLGKPRNRTELVQTLIKEGLSVSWKRRKEARNREPNRQNQGAAVR